ncbi:gamma-glutamylcyclotransferase [Mesorhizobium sp. M0923]|nr:gamma-glutamylcyclotransferase [Mesorhizobium sp. L48C026A00]
MRGVRPIRPSGSSLTAHIWKPAFDAFEERSAVTFGWRRSFRLQLTRWCGTPDRPGLMLALDRGGSCRGIA